MPQSGIERAIIDFQKRILARERKAASEMVRAYFQAWKRVRARLNALQLDYERTIARGEEVSPHWIYLNSRLNDLQELIGKEMQRFSVMAERRITEEQKQAIIDSLEFNREMIILQMGPEYEVPEMMRVKSLPTSAIETMVGMNQVDSPLRRLFSSFTGAAVQAASDALIGGMILGYNPRKIAPMIRDALGIQLDRALTISRTEVLRAHREAAHKTYEENADVVKGWRWQASLDGRTCAVCISLHGREFPLSEKMSSHPNCRCVATPITYSWEELGERFGVDWSGVDEAGPSFEEVAKKYNMSPEQIARYKARTGTGEDYFKSLKPEEQIRIMGKGRWTAWKDGIINFDEIVKDTWSPEWGAGKTIVSLKEVLDPEQIQKYQKLGSEYFQIVSSKAEATPTAYKIAEGLLAKYKEAEPDLTSMLKELVGEQGGTMAGLGDRLKSIDSLARKITSDALSRQISEIDASNRLTDVSRYTGIFNSNSLIDNAKNISETLVSEGFTIRKIKNNLGGDGIYHGLHMIFEKSGISFELQFHTEQSFEIKTSNHADYEVWRAKNVSNDLIAMVEKWMLEAWKDYVPPKLFELISDYP